MPNKPKADSPATIVAILVAARRTGDRELERDMRQQLSQRFGITISFCRERAEAVAQ
jgi:hypothetical protein